MRKKKEKMKRKKMEWNWWKEKKEKKKETVKNINRRWKEKIELRQLPAFSSESCKSYLPFTTAPSTRVYKLGENISLYQHLVSVE